MLLSLILNILERRYVVEILEACHIPFFNSLLLETITFNSVVGMYLPFPAAEYVIQMEVKLPDLNCPDILKNASFKGRKEF